MSPNLVSFERKESYMISCHPFWEGLVSKSALFQDPEFSKILEIRDFWSIMKIRDFWSKMGQKASPNGNSLNAHNFLMSLSGLKV